MDDLIPNCYRILGLQPGASKEEIREGFKKIKGGCLLYLQWKHIDL